MKLTIPEQIKSKLVDDWETVTKDNKVTINVLYFSAKKRLRVAFEIIERNRSESASVHSLRI